jgi:hypothetical protein
MAERLRRQTQTRRERVLLAAHSGRSSETISEVRELRSHFRKLASRDASSHHGPQGRRTAHHRRPGVPVAGVTQSERFAHTSRSETLGVVLSRAMDGGDPFAARQWTLDECIVELGKARAALRELEQTGESPDVIRRKTAETSRVTDACFELIRACFIREHVARHRNPEHAEDDAQRRVPMLQDKLGSEATDRPTHFVRKDAQWSALACSRKDKRLADRERKDAGPLAPVDSSVLAEQRELLSVVSRYLESKDCSVADREVILAQEAGVELDGKKRVRLLRARARLRDWLGAQGIDPADYLGGDST